MLDQLIVVEEEPIAFVLMHLQNMRIDRHPTSNGMPEAKVKSPQVRLQLARAQHATRRGSGIAKHANKGRILEPRPPHRQCVGKARVLETIGLAPHEPLDPLGHLLRSNETSAYCQAREPPLISLRPVAEEPVPDNPRPVWHYPL